MIEKRKKNCHVQNGHLNIPGMKVEEQSGVPDSVLASPSNFLPRKVWFIDSGGAKHVACQKYSFLEYSELDRPSKIYIRGNNAISAKWKKDDYM